MARKLILEGPYKGRSVILQRLRFTNGVCDISHMSPEDSLKVAHHMATFYQARLVDDVLSPDVEVVKVEETADAAAEAGDEVSGGVPDGGGAGTAAPEPAPLERDAGAEARKPAVSGNRDHRPRNAGRY